MAEVFTFCKKVWGMREPGTVNFDKPSLYFPLKEIVIEVSEYLQNYFVYHHKVNCCIVIYHHPFLSDVYV